MKLIHQSTTGGRGPAAFKVIPEEPEDLWHLYNLLVAGDKVQATTVRKVTRETGAASGGGGESERVKVKLLLLAESFELEQARERPGREPRCCSPFYAHSLRLCICQPN